MAKTITLTQTDYDRLKALTSVDPDPSDLDKNAFQELRAELYRAVVVDPKEIDPNVVTVNSRVLIQDVATGEEKEYTLVFPLAADFSVGKISVLVPLGTALLGFRKGDVVEWKVPGGLRKFKIKKVLYQPEAAGNFES